VEGIFYFSTYVLPCFGSTIFTFFNRILGSLSSADFSAVRDSSAPWFKKIVAPSLTTFAA
jgi:hypothetical protein